MWAFGRKKESVAEVEQKPSINVDLLLTRMRTSGNISDRRQAILELNNNLNEVMADLGSEEFIALMHVMRKDKHDQEVCNMIMMMMTEFIESSHKERILGYYARAESELRGIETMLFALREHDFHVQYNILKFLALLVEYHPDIVDRFSGVKDGLHTLVGLLNRNDDNGIIRNEALLLMKSLAISDPNIQQVIVYEGIFNCLFAIIADEGGIQGGIIAEDCLDILHHLLATNASNQKYLRDSIGLNSLLPLLTFEEVQLSASAVKVLVLTISLISYFLKRGESDAELSKTIDAIAGITYDKNKQEVLSSESLLTGLAAVAIHTSPNPDAHIESIRCLTELAASSKRIQEQLASLVIERKSGHYKWLDTISLYVTVADEPGRIYSTSELLATLLSNNEICMQLSNGLIGECTGTQQSYPVRVLMNGIFSNNTTVNYYCCAVLTKLFSGTDSRDVVQKNASSCTFHGKPAFAAVVEQLIIAIKTARPAFSINSLFSLCISWVAGNSHAVSMLSDENLLFFVKTANAHGMELLSTQLLCCTFLGVMKLSNPPEHQNRFVTDALLRKISISSYVGKLNSSIAEEPAFESARPRFFKSTPQVWDAETVLLVKQTQEAVQAVLMNDLCQSAPASENAAPTAAPTAVDSDDSLRQQQIIKKQDIELSSLRMELKKVKKEFTELKNSSAGEEKKNMIPPEVLAQKEKEKADLTAMLTESEYQLDTMRSKLSLIQSTASSHPEVMEVLTRFGLSNLIALDDSFIASPTETQQHLQQHQQQQQQHELQQHQQQQQQNDLLLEQEKQFQEKLFQQQQEKEEREQQHSTEMQKLQKKLAQLELDQNDLYALLGEYDERLRKLTARGVAK
eukprot:TRINITY_DN2808_c0_g1_i4.p1 TRINITY_DN2808_c0_g1~~TRINITY_DN2808_c0_g1_i4.p1  ORF type:complete len:857 (+),score=186.55 TRINITY_DN2808_c0_g1_i4:77-2647(+)